MSARLSAFAAWALVAAGVVFWGLRLGVTPLVAPAGTPTVAEALRPPADLSRLLGAAPAPAAAVPVAESSRFRLVGVIADAQPAGATGAARRGVALLAVDGKPPRAFRIGATVDGGSLALLSVARRAVQIGPRGGPPSVSLELPPPPPPASGVLPRIGPDGAVVEGSPAPPGMAPPGMALPGMAPPGSLPPGMTPPGFAPPPGSLPPEAPQTGSQDPAGRPPPGLFPPNGPQAR